MFPWSQNIIYLQCNCPELCNKAKACFKESTRRVFSKKINKPALTRPSCHFIGSLLYYWAPILLGVHIVFNHTEYMPIVVSKTVSYVFFWTFGSSASYLRCFDPTLSSKALLLLPKTRQLRIHTQQWRLRYALHFQQLS